MGLDEDQVVAIAIAVNITDRHRRASAASSSSAFLCRYRAIFPQRTIGVLAFVGYDCRDRAIPGTARRLFESLRAHPNSSHI